MTLALKDKIALVTGGSGGIGGETARRLAAQGAKVAVTYRSNAQSALALVDEIQAAGGGAMAIGGDVAQEADASRIADAVAAAFGQIDILVNNAGTLRSLPLGQITAADIDDQFAANVRGVVLMTQAAIRHFPDEGGQVINVSSTLAKGASYDGIALYGASKAAVDRLTEAFARELGPRHIRVNAVAPGGVHTRMTARLTDERIAEMASRTPLGRFGEPDDIADVIVFFASPQSRWITGRSLVVDGGYS
jgi:3-oxoacyl-[acyl-carrier protein] reductase